METFFRCVAAIQTAYFWFAVITTTTAAFAIQVFCWICLLPILIAFPTFRIQLMGRIIRLSSIIGGFVLHPFWHVKIVRQPPPGYYPLDTLLMVNHASAADAWVVAKSIFPWELKFVFKAALYKFPIGGWAIWLAHDVPIFFTKAKGGWGTEKGSVSETMKEVKKLMSRDIGVVVFPEGTRSLTGRLQLFKDGFFRYAIENCCEILPCVSHSTRDLWPIGSSLINSGTAYFAFGDPIRVKPGDTLEDLKDLVRNSMIELFTYCPKYDAEKEKPLNEIACSRGHGVRGKFS